MKLWLLSLLFFLASCQEYEPGNPGGAWSQEELLIVRAKLWQLFTNNWTYKLSDEFWTQVGLPIPDNKVDLGFFAAKVLRLSFHDCMRYADGSGGCDGCLSWSGVGYRFPDDTETIKYKFRYDDIKETNNNGLEHTVAVLEQVYTDPNFPSKTTTLPLSLKESGKSRADLWAYAAKVAVEYTTEDNNYMCQSMPSDWSGSLVNHGSFKDCLRNVGDDDCEVKMPREINFQYGRKDCISEYSESYEQYKTDRLETHPNPEGNGDATLDFFNEEFGFTGRETVAIMGAHTLGRMRPQHSLLKYVWTTRAGNTFNNAYYKNFVKEKEWFLESSDGNTCTFLGDAYGTLPDTKWVPTMNGFTKSGGPMHWIRMHYACNYCGSRPPCDDCAMGDRYDECCPGRPEGLACIPDNATRNDVDDVVGCEKFRFAFGRDEMMMNAEAGLYFKFDEENGIPKNCEGLEHFNMENWINDNGKVNSSDTVRRAYHMNCPLNDRRLPKEDNTVSGIISEYAENQDLWVNEFIGAFEKMMRNGYQDGELTDAPGSWENVVCKRIKNKMTCQQA